MLLNPLGYPWWVRLLYQLAFRPSILIGVVLIVALVAVAAVAIVLEVSL